MKKLLVTAIVLVLAGQGCPGLQTETQPDTSDTPSNEAEPVAEMTDEPTEVSIEIGSEGSATIETTDDTGLEPVSVQMETGNFFFDSSVIRAKAGQEVTVNFAINDGFHTLVIDELKINEQVKEGESFTFTAPNEPGEYPFYCSVGNHRAMGMEGVLIVE